jgi:hypothetical protein
MRIATLLKFNTASIADSIYVPSWAVCCSHQLAPLLDPNALFGQLKLVANQDVG